MRSVENLGGIVESDSVFYEIGLALGGVPLEAYYGRGYPTLIVYTNVFDIVKS